MNWFKNLNATPRLMSSFGAVLVLTLGIGYLSIHDLTAANVRIGDLYQDNLRSIAMLDKIAIAKADNQSKIRDAIINLQNQSAVAADLDAIKTDIDNINSNLKEVEPLFTAKEELALIAEIQTTLPEYEKAVDGIISSIGTKDPVAANASLAASAKIVAQFSSAIDRASSFNEGTAKDNFESNVKAYKSARSIIIGAICLSLLLGVILSILIARSFSVPLGMAVEALEKVAGGDLTVSLDVDTKDEVGRMAHSLNRTIEKLNNTLQQVADSAANASSSSQQLAAAAEAIASGAQEQAASLEETSASLEEITAAVRQSADNAQQASQLAAGSKDSALQGQDVVSKAITAMAEINASSAKISDIISTIDEIAFQTNLLAVNAAVEAARAGDEGRGFAVVASEVRSLAQRSAVAAKEIKVLIQDSLHKVDAGSGLVNRSGETLHGIVGSVKRVTDIVGEMAASAGEQSTGIEQVNTAMTQMDQVTQSNSAQTEELSATAQALSEQAAHLMELVSTFMLSQNGSNHRERQAFQPHLANSVKPVQQPSPALHLSSGARQLAKTVRISAAARPTPNGKRPKSLLPALAIAIPNGPAVNDASFEEF